jgi:hypothetical protein
MVRQKTDQRLSIVAIRRDERDHARGVGYELDQPLRDPKAQVIYIEQYDVAAVRFDGHDQLAPVHGGDHLRLPGRRAAHGVNEHRVGRQHEEVGNAGPLAMLRRRPRDSGLGLRAVCGRTFRVSG